MDFSTSFSLLGNTQNSSQTFLQREDFLLLSVNLIGRAENNPILQWRFNQCKRFKLTMIFLACLHKGL